MPGKCYFKDSWLDESEWMLWLRKGKDKYTAFCSFCKKSFDVSHSGINCIKVHAQGKKHKEIVANLNSGKQLTLHALMPKASNASSAANVCGSISTSDGASSSRPMPSTECNEPLLKNVPQSIGSFLVSDNVTKCEIIWSAHCVSKNLSLRAGGSAVQLFPLMFPDSCISGKMQLHKDKIGYGVTYGLGPYFSQLVIESARKSTVFALSIDESLNEICQKQQMDFMINYWDMEMSRIATRYLTSVFLERSTASDLLDNLLLILTKSNLTLDNLVQLSTDGPNVNLKLIFDLNIHMKNVLSKEKQILDVGTCSLHIINGAYKTAHAKVGWNLNTFLRALYRLFKNYPSRRAIYSQVTNSKLFPKKFCAIRWTENSSVIRRSLDMFEHLKDYVNNVSEAPNSDNFQLVKKCVLEDKTLQAKLHFCAMIAEELEEFLVNFQRNDPLLPFLYQEVFSLMKSLGSKIFKKRVIDTVNTATKLKKIDLTCSENLLAVDAIDIGFGARSCLKNVRELDAQKFKSDCKKFLTIMFEKLMAKSPLNKRAVLGATCINPQIMINETLRKSSVQVMIEEFVHNGQLSPAEGDIVMRHYMRFCDNSEVQGKLETYNWKKDRLDVFLSALFDLFREDELDNRLKSFFQRILVCFHGNAAVERSFSYNKNFLVENLQEKSLVAQRALHDHITTLEGGLCSLNVTKKMIQEYRNASSRRKEALKAKKLAEDEVVNEKKRALQEIQELKKKKQRLLEDKGEELAQIESKLSSLKRKL